MIHPTIHLNGSGRAALLDQYTAAAGAVVVSIEALQLTAQYGRDYVYIDDCRWARREYEARLAKLLEVQEELLRLAKSVRRAS
jgi:hypothetical protein